MATSNTAPAWRRAFLRELGRSGSVALAAQKCGIDRTSPYQVRRKNPAFAASWDRALETARERLKPLTPRAPAQAGASGGLALHLRHEAPARPEAGLSRAADLTASRRAGAHKDSERAGPRLLPDQIVRSSKSGRPCIVRAGPGRWSVRAERAFLAELTATANVKAAARAAGVSAQAAYNRRRLWPAFAAAWAEAKAEGYERIEMLLIHAATATLDPEPEVEAREAPLMSVDQAMKLWFHRSGQQGGKPQRYGWRLQEPDIEEVRAEILRKVAAMERARG